MTGPHDTQRQGCLGLVDVHEWDVVGAGADFWGSSVCERCVRCEKVRWVRVFDRRRRPGGKH